MTTEETLPYRLRETAKQGPDQRRADLMKEAAAEIEDLQSRADAYRRQASYAWKMVDVVALAIKGHDEIPTD